MIMEKKIVPCELDQDGECLVCDCFVSDCAWQRYLKKDYSCESKRELEVIFKKYIGENDSDSTLPQKSAE
jgi:hypothetical protein